MASQAGYISDVEVFYDTAGLVGCLVVGKDGTISPPADLSILLSLDGNTNTLALPGTLKLCGDLIVTGTTTIAGTAVGDLSAMLDALGT